MKSPAAHSYGVVGASLRTHHGGSFLLIDKKDPVVGNGLFLAREVKSQQISQLNVEKKSAQISTKPSPIAWKWSRVGQIWSQIVFSFF